MSTFPRSVPRLLTAVALGLLTSASSVAAQSVARLIVAPIALRLEPRVSRDVVAEAFDESGAVIPGARAGLTFASTDTSVVQISPTGTAIAIRIGRAEIVVKAGAQTRRVVVMVTPPGQSSAAPAPVVVSNGTVALDTPAAPPAVEAVASGPTVVSALIQPGNIQLLPTERFKPTFRLRFSDATSADANDVVWNTFGSSIGFDMATSEVIGVVPGNGVLGGRYGQSITASVPVSVGEVNLVPDHDSVLLVAGAMDTVRLLVPAQGRRVVTQNLSWRTTDPAVLKVMNPVEGVVQARDGGTADLIVDGYGVTRRIPVRVSPRVERIDTPMPAGTLVTLAAGGGATIEAKPFGTAGTVLTTVALQWRSKDSTIARVDARGNLLGLREGSTEITLDGPGMQQLVWPVTVAQARVAVAAHRFSMPTGALKPMIAELRAGDGRDFGRAASPVWTSSAPQIATVDASGTVSARRPGRAVITVAQQGAGTDTAVVFVTGRVLLAGTVDEVPGVWQLLAANDSVPELLFSSDSGGFTQATWSPDRTRIAVTLEPEDKAKQSSVMVMDADGGNRRIISPDFIESSDPAWTRDGTALLFALRDGKVSTILRVPVAGGKPDTLVQVTEGRLRSPVPGNDSGEVFVRLEKGNAMDLARVRGGSLQMLTTTKPREELLSTLRDGRLLLSVDSSGRSRPGTLQWVTVAGDGVEIVNRIPLPPGLLLLDIAAGHDDNAVLVVGRARSWPNETGPVVVVLNVTLDGAPPKVLLILSEKDTVTARSD